eukprot:TRINITY_DN93939_c0_g1_i1.p1 TRINITY_DN93939_c0_g1~~TRINITY_DN93939_c0_g1_i1.p1  ORF type:complete len:239 (-),score=51.12 TRINITY_DN93939_c0_g1_i1:75-791(-)
MAFTVAGSERRAARRSTCLPLALGLACVLGHGSLSFISLRQATHAAPRSEGQAELQRRQLLGGLALTSALPAPAFAFETYEDKYKGFGLKLPTGVQKYDNKGYDYFWRDLLEPLEFIAVKVLDSTRNDLKEVGPPEEVAKKIMGDLIPQGAPQELISATSGTNGLGGREDTIEFAYQWKFDQQMARMLGRQKFQLHAKAKVTVANKKQYLVIIASEENRWQFRGEDYKIALDSFGLIA